MPYSRTLATLVLIGAIIFGTRAAYALVTGFLAIAHGKPVNADWILPY